MATSVRTTAEVVDELFAALKRYGWERRENNAGNVYWKVTMRKKLADGREICIGCDDIDRGDDMVLRTVGDPKGLHFTQLEKMFRYTVGDTGSLNKAIAKAMRFAQEFQH